MATNYVFVYGTLLNMHNLRAFGMGSPSRDIKLVGKARTLQEFALYDGGYPMALPAGHKNVGETKTGHIVGQLFEVTDSALAALDRYEGYPDFYSRQETPIKVIDPDVEMDGITPWIYIGADSGAAEQAVRRGVCLPNEEGDVQWRNF